MIISFYEMSNRSEHEEGAQKGCMMKTSVAMCTYNGEAYIKEQFLSICNQTHTVDEVIIFDDNSTDNTINIINELIENFSGIKFVVNINEDNIGFRKNFRQAIAECKGDFIFIADQDDVWIDTKVEHALCFFENHKDCLALISDFWAIDGNGNRFQKTEVVENILVSNRVAYNKTDFVKINPYEGLMGTVGQGCATVINRQLADLYLKCNINWTHDHLIDCIAVLHNGLYFTKEKLIYYRIHGNNTISMPIGKDNQRKIGLPTRIKETYGCLNVVHKCDRNECEKQIYDMGDFSEVETIVGVNELVKKEIAKWRKIRIMRLKYLEQRKLVHYIILRLCEREYFENAVTHCTYEQRLLGLLYELGVILKK